MTRIGLMSDTHSFLDPRILEFFKDVDEVWHAGDIGSIEVLEALRKFKLLRAVYGNADGFDIRRELAQKARVVFDAEKQMGVSSNDTPEEMSYFKVEGVNVLMTHIGGYPGKYSRNAAKEIKKLRPDIFVAGHSHILKVIYDKVNNCLHLNPGACGHYGIHVKRTVLKFEIDVKEIKNMEILELNA